MGNLKPEPGEGGKIRRGKKKIFRISAIALAAVLFLVIACSLFVYFHKSTLKSFLEKTLSKKAGLTVVIGRLNYRLFPLRVEAESVKVVFVNKPGRADVRIGRAEASGSLWRLINNQKPFFDSLTVSGLNIEFAEHPNAPPSGPVSIRDLARMVSGNLEYVSDLVVKDASLHLSLPGEGMDLSATGVNLKAAATDKTTIGLIVTRLDFRSDKPKVTLAAGLRCEATWPRTEPFSLEGTLDLTDSSISLPEKQWEGPSFSLKTGFLAGERSVVVSAFTLDIPDLVALSGSGLAELGQNAVVTISSKLNIKNLERAKKTFAPFLPPDLPAFSLDGSAQWEGDLRRETASGAAKIYVNGALHLPPAHFIMKQGSLSVDQVLLAELHFQDEPAGLRVNGFIEGRQGRLLAGSFQAGGFSFRLPVEIEGSRVNIPSLKAQVQELVLSAGNRKLKLDDISISGNTKLDYLHQAVKINSLAVDVPRLGSFGLTGEVGLNPQRQVNLSLSSRNLDIGNILKFFPAFVPETMKAWKPGGQLDLSLTIRNGPSDPRRYRVKGTGDLSKVAFQDSSGAIVSEGLDPRLRFEADILSFDKAIPFSLELNLAKGESLWKDAYFNWQSGPVRLELKGTLDLQFRQVRDAAAAVFFPPLGEVRAGGSLGFGPKPHFDFHLAAPSIDLASLNAFLGKMRPGQPSTWEVQGKAEAEVDIRLDTSFKVRGKVQVREAAARQKDGSLGLAGIDADFPFSFSHGVPPGDEKTDDSLAPGYILIQEIKTPVVVLKALRLDFYSTKNLFLFFPIEIGLWGSRLELGQFVLAINPVSRGIRGVSNLTLTGLDFSKLPINSESFKLAGWASIPTSELEIRPGEFRLRGRLLADIFGGRLTMNDIRVTDVFSAGRKIVFQAEISGLDLGKLTASVPFGEVTGIVDVSIRDFVLSYGQPENFLLSIISVPRKGVSRKFSLKAVNNLSVISSDGPSTALSNNVLTKLVHSFSYSRIGIACSLKNDVFTLQGTIVEGRIQYLVRRSTFFGIDVVNGNPVNKISFKDMIGRMKRVGRSQEKK
ncbi:MAG: hypothetical protein Q8O91_01890 [Candidatus Aminicenantes bacterium]|nr:hypothetical protein [Candidatus Aminicenantes bacterium]